MKAARKKIVLIGPAHPLRGGLAAFNERLALQLQDEGHEVVIYTFSFQYPAFLFPGKTQYSTDAAPVGLNIRACIHSLNPFNWKAVARKIAVQQPDLVVISYWISFMAPALGNIAGRIKKKSPAARIIGLLHNLSPHEPKPFDKPLSAYFIKRCDAFLVLSKEVLKEIQQRTKKPSLLSPHPVYDHFGEAVAKEAARKQLGLEEDGRYLLFFGLIRAYKGLDILLRAMADPRIKENSTRLIIAGEFYEDPKKYDQLIRELDLAERLVMHTHFIPNDEVKYYFSACDAVVQPYRTATQSGISQMAFHFEKPMILTRVGGLPEIVPEGKCGLFSEADPNALAETILAFYQLGEPHFKPCLAAEKQKYSWSSFTAALLSLA
jgi:glycosyltransferase involved in cell wall biosynthesis